MRVIIRGKAYRLEFVRKIEGDALGMCDAPNVSAKRIRVLERLRGEKRISTLIHEALHGALWDLDEEAVRETADDIARLLWRLGYRAEK